MGISEKKMKIVIDNYFRSECDVNTSIKEAFEKGFRIGIIKGQSAQPERKMGKWNFIGDQMFECTECGVCYTQNQFHQMMVRITDPEFPKFCPNCGADMRGVKDETN